MNFRRLIFTGAFVLPTSLVMPASPSAARLESMETQGIEQQAEPARIAEVPPAPWADADPADSLYRAGREAINREDYRRAATIFSEIGRRFPKSEYAADAGYWRAFALYKAGRDADLQDALRAIESQQKSFPRAKTAGDASTLAVRINGELGKRGYSGSAQKVAEAATGDDTPCTRNSRNDEDLEMRIAALNALLQMDAQSAVPIIKNVLSKRDGCSAALREKAVFLLSQKQTSETEALLIDVVRNDPNRSVREQAVFWLGQVRTDKAAAALEEIATSSRDMELREKAIFALNEQGSPRAAALLRRFAESADTPSSVREHAIFWLGQKRSSENAEFLRSLFGKLGKAEQNDELRKKILFSLSQMQGVGNDRWLLAIALDASYSEELRGHALWTATQAGIPGADLVSIYDKLTDPQVKEKLIWVLSESRDRASSDKLVDIAQKDPDREMRKKAIFWLGQKNDPRIRQILIDILNKP
ncbi:MAG: HEAT repeat domain-containing protein [Gemmatimonadaceae bacterium]